MDQPHRPIAVTASNPRTHLTLQALQAAGQSQTALHLHSFHSPLPLDAVAFLIKLLNRSAAAALASGIIALEFSKRSNSLNY